MTMIFPKVAIILINWNGKLDTLECLSSLSHDIYPNKEIVVVDNGSTDDSVEAIQANFPDVTLLETGSNLGFTGGNNVGIRYALDYLDQETGYIFLLNNDTTVEPNALTSLVAASLVNPLYGLLTPIINYYDSPTVAWFAGSRIDLTRGLAIHDNNCPPDEAKVRDVPWASGCSMLIRASLIQTLGGFDERYYLNWEDVDLSLRVRREKSNIGLVPFARIYHKVSRTLMNHSDKAHFYYVRNNLLLVQTHSGEQRRNAIFCVMNRLVRNDLRAIKNRQNNALRKLRITIYAFQHHCQRRYGRCERI